MRKVRYFSKFVYTGMLSLCLGTLSGQAVQAQPTTSLVDLACVTTRSPYADYAYRQYSQDISIGREIYRTVMWVNSNSSFTCKLPANRRASLRLKFGIQDSNKDAVPTTLQGATSAPKARGKRGCTRQAPTPNTELIDNEMDGGRNEK
jgi:hypothetical protein